MRVIITSHNHRESHLKKTACASDCVVVADCPAVKNIDVGTLLTFHFFSFSDGVLCFRPIF